MKVALTFSINWARYQSLRALKDVLQQIDRKLEISDMDVLTCPVELEVSPIANETRIVSQQGRICGKKFKTVAELSMSLGNNWELGRLTVCIGEHKVDCALHHYGGQMQLAT